MSNGINWEKKYKDLRSTFVEALDVSYRNGYEQGMNDAAAQQIQEQQAQMAAQQQQQAQMMGQMSAPQQGQEAQGYSPVGPDEMDSAISELEQLVNKSEDSENLQKLKKSLESLRMAKATKDLVTSLKKNKFKESVITGPVLKSMRAHVPTETKKEVAMQSKVIDDVFKKWNAESQASTNNILDVLGVENISKK